MYRNTGRGRTESVTVDDFFLQLFQTLEVRVQLLLSQLAGYWKRLSL